jgi:ATP-dependent metalloprotease FtsH
MFQNFNNKKQTDANLRMMSISAIILVVLFIYVLLKNDTAIKSGSYYIGVIFLFILMALAFTLQKYKTKIKKYIPNNKFSTQLEKSIATQKQEELTNTKIMAVKSDATFDNVAGIEDVKIELEEIVDFLNNPKKYIKHGATLPKGVLLVGPAGVGKTLMAKAVAGVANVPFFYQSGASFVNIYVGMGAKKVRELFDTAKAQAPSIIFIDEIDAIGKERGIGVNDEREATLNELLTQMDGFSKNNGVIVIGATNKIDILDDALLRAGRFDRRVFLTLPSKEDRLKILKLYLKDKQYNFNVEKLALDTSGFNSASLSTLVNEALLIMIKRGGTSLVDDDIQIAKKKIQFGKKQCQLLNATSKNILAIYQASKAYISQTKVMLLDEGISKPEFIYPSKTQLEQQIQNNLAGSIGVEVILKEPYAIYESEIKEAYKIARMMVEKYNMATSINEIIDAIKSNLKEKIITNKDEILKLKEILLKDEVIVF